jgi:hypothetical protein
MKRIGWVVQTRWRTLAPWHSWPLTIQAQRSWAIRAFEKTVCCDKHNYLKRRRNGLARCVPVFVEDE